MLLPLTCALRIPTRASQAELHAIAEATFWHELAHAIPGLVDLLVVSDDVMRKRIGRALRAACRQALVAAERPERSALVSVHRHPRLLGLRYAPLVREVHRPLLLRFLVHQGVDVDRLRARAPLKVVHLQPPPFMGPPSGPPSGVIVAPPGTQPDPQQLVSALQRHADDEKEDDEQDDANKDAGAGAGAAGADGGGGTVIGLARPHSMGPPRFGPCGEWVVAPEKPARPKEEEEIASKEMLAPQKLAHMRQLMRRIATATSEEADPYTLSTDLGGIAQLAARRRKVEGGDKPAYAAKKGAGSPGKKRW